jgi:hypothetical protein
VDGREWLATVFEPGLRSETLAFNLEDTLLRTQLQTLRDCDVLGEAEAADALRRLDAAFEAAQRRIVPEVRQPRRSYSPPPVLVRVLAPVGQVVEADGLTIMVVSAELWSDEVYVHLAVIPTDGLHRLEQEHDRAVADWFERRKVEGDRARSPAGPGERLAYLPLALDDGIGTEYKFHGGSSGGGRGDYRLMREFRPGVPPEAERLELVVSDADGQVVARLDLGLPTERP